MRQVTTKPPRGIVGIFTDKLGRVVATVAEFETGGYGGCSLRESQTYRAKHMLNLEVMRGYCSEMIHEALENHDCDKIVQRLVKGGATVTFVPVGYDGEGET